MENALTVIKNIATVTGCGISIFTFVGLTIKPLRKKIGDWFVKVTCREKIEEIDERVQRLENEEKIILELFEELKEINKRIFENERDRLRGELFNCGNRCRRGLALYSDEYRYIQSVYKKYNEELHENSIGTDEYEFIKEYFESPLNQEFIKK